MKEDGEKNRLALMMKLYVHWATVSRICSFTLDSRTKQYNSLQIKAEEHDQRNYFFMFNNKHVFLRFCHLPSISKDV